MPACNLVEAPNHFAVDKDKGDAGGDQLRLFEGCPVDNCRRIEEHQISFEARTNQSSILEAKPYCRQRSHLPNCFCQTKPVLLACESAQHSRKSSSTARVARPNAAITAYHHPRLLIKDANVCVFHRM